MNPKDLKAILNDADIELIKKLPVGRCLHLWANDDSILIVTKHNEEVMHVMRIE